MGPLSGGGRAQNKARRGEHRDVLAFAQRRMRCRRTLGARTRTRRAGCPEGARPGWPFSWLLLFGHSKRSDSGRPKAGTKRFLTWLRKTNQGPIRRPGRTATMRPQCASGPRGVRACDIGLIPGCAFAPFAAAVDIVFLLPYRGAVLDRLDQRAAGAEGGV